MRFVLSSRTLELAAVLALSLPFAVACSSSGNANSTGSGASSASSGSATGGGSSTGGGGSSTGGGGSTGTQTSGVGGSGGGSVSAPSVIQNVPLDGATDVPLNAHPNATFSEAMDGATLTPGTFTLTSAPGAVAVPGTVTYGNDKATFWPTAHLAGSTTFTATISVGAESANSVPLAADYTWSFTTGETIGPELPVDLGAAGNYVMLAKTAISTVPGSDVTGDLGLSPAAASYITGFSLIADATNVFSTSSQVTGKVFAADYAVPTPANLTAAISDMELAFTAAAARAPDITALGAGNIGGMVLSPGVYRWGTGLLIPTDVTLDGSATDVWVFQVAQDLTVSSGAQVILSGGALAKNVFWQAAGFISLGTTAHFEGVVLSQTAITLETGTSINGRLLAQTAVTIEGSTVVAPAP